MTPPALISAIARVRQGRWAVGVSGGADSVALLRLLHERSDLSLHVVHLDHETRGEASTGDASFVAALADQLELPITTALRSDVEGTLSNPPANISSRYRMVRLALFQRAVAEHSLEGVVLAHHADDQAETVLHRLLRGSGPVGLAAMRSTTNIDGLLIQRPLVDCRREMLRDYLRGIGQNWREDASNQSDDYLRNRLRRVLVAEPGLTERLVELGDACRALRECLQGAAPTLKPEFAARELADLPSAIASESARRWLIEQNVTRDEITPAVIDRLTTMAADAGIKAAQFPGGISIRRRKGIIFAEASPSS